MLSLRGVDVVNKISLLRYSSAINNDDNTFQDSISLYDMLVVAVPHDDESWVKEKI